MFGNNDRLLKFFQVVNIVLSAIIGAALVAYGIVYAVLAESPIAVIFIVGGVVIGFMSWVFGMMLLYIVRDLKFIRNKLYDVGNKGHLKKLEMDPYTYNAGMYPYPPYARPPYSANVPYGGYGNAPVRPEYGRPVPPAPASVNPAAPRANGSSVLKRLTKEEIEKLSESKKKELKYVNELLAKGKISATQYNAEIANILKED